MRGSGGLRWRSRRLHAWTVLLLLIASPSAGQPVPPGEALYKGKCALCHAGFAPGVLMLSRRRGKDKSLLAERGDLTVPYVRTVVRRGLNSMPAITRVEVTDPELDAIAAYLTRNAPR